MAKPYVRMDGRLREAQLIGMVDLLNDFDPRDHGPARGTTPAWSRPAKRIMGHPPAMDAELIVEPRARDVTEQARPSVAAPATVVDRRRPGRLDQVNPALIPLLRDTTESGDDTDKLGPSRGIASAMLISVPLWAVMGAAVWFIEAIVQAQTLTPATMQ